jgi:hypothetical protein
MKDNVCTMVSCMSYPPECTLNSGPKPCCDTCRRGTVVAMGAASGQLIANSFYDRLYHSLITPRWGHLIEVPYPEGSKRLHHGVMHASYTRHYAKPPDCTIPTLEERAAADRKLLTCDVTFTATTGTNGTLLLGVCATPVLLARKE